MKLALSSFRWRHLQLPSIDSFESYLARCTTPLELSQLKGQPGRATIKSHVSGLHEPQHCTVVPLKSKGINQCYRQCSPLLSRAILILNEREDLDSTNKLRGHIETSWEQQ